MCAATYRGFVTSATVIERSQWRIQGPINWENLCPEKAQHFIKTAPVRDTRANMERNRFRMLLVQPPDSYTTFDWTHFFKSGGSAVLRAAGEACWIGDEFKYYVEKGTTGATVVETENSISLIAQTPKDNLPFFSLALTELNNGRQKSDADWVCLVFADQGVDLEKLMCNVPFPSDFSPPFSPDLMFLPVSLLQWQVEQTRDHVNYLTERIVGQDEKLISEAPVFDKIKRLEEIRSALFRLEKEHLMLHRRWTFEQDLAAKLLQCFQAIERRKSHDELATYSQKLRQRVHTQSDLSSTLRHDLDTVPEKIRFQHAMIDGKINITIAHNSGLAANAARRDSSFMKTIAIITLLFLPGTFVAAVFSMSMFTWESDGSVVVSRHLWLYFAIAVPLTLVVMIIWVLWTLRGEKDYRKKAIADPEKVYMRRI
ncbi:hypothetical protein DRE_06041 [Drechslerella stenobrocha 248]|uniref:Uncharacterized protein n=1 Tax=Drechslerella stenobrocha 248 TaxID=1043628 RepID=W7HYY7_9PEZI|nr:hypothetical protein DRE_06041 [Drechslerella stenobrocha 248]